MIDEFMAHDSKLAIWQFGSQHQAQAAPPPAPAEPDLVPASIDKSQLPVAEPKRLRDKAHLKFVATQPCLVCK
jgi:hypothetical protein